jgi:hypothetical protein
MVEEQEFALFQRMEWWELLPALAWITTRDMAFACHAGRQDVTPHSIDVRLSLEYAWSELENASLQHDYRSLVAAWDSGVAIQLANDELYARAVRVDFNQAGVSTSQGKAERFPPKENPDLAADFQLRDLSSKGLILSPRPIRSPRSELTRGGFTEWHGVRFPAKKVRELWPLYGPAAPKTAVPGRKRGPKEKHPWGDIDAFILDWLEDNGSPQFGDKAACVDAVTRIYTNRDGEGPPRSSLFKRLEKLIPQWERSRLGN